MTTAYLRQGCLQCSNQCSLLLHTAVAGRQGVCPDGLQNSLHQGLLATEFCVGVVLASWEHSKILSSRNVLGKLQVVCGCGGFSGPIAGSRCGHHYDVQDVECCVGCIGSCGWHRCCAASDGSGRDQECRFRVEVLLDGAQGDDLVQVLSQGPLRAGQQLQLCSLASQVGGPKQWAHVWQGRCVPTVYAPDRLSGSWPVHECASRKSGHAHGAQETSSSRADASDFVGHGRSADAKLYCCTDIECRRRRSSQGCWCWCIL